MAGQDADQFLPRKPGGAGNGDAGEPGGLAGGTV
jgi:hypothetical protein